MLYSAQELRNLEIATEIAGRWVVARPLWVSWGRWKHAWWVLTGRCDAIWWPQDGNPYWTTAKPKWRAEVTTQDPLRFLSKSRIEDRGLGGYLFVWRRGDADGARKAVGVSLGEWLSRPEHFGGQWLIEAGQGAPPGAFCVTWDNEQSAWRWGGIARPTSDGGSEHG